MLARIAHKIANRPFVKKLLTENRLFVRLYFNWRYRGADPYEVTTHADERDKYKKIVGALGVKEKFDNILEIGCGEGHLTQMIAHKGARVLAIDISDFAIGRAKKNVAGFKHAEAKRIDIITADMDETFELVLCSEVLFYFEPDQLDGVVKKIKGLIKPGGYAALIHTLVKSDDGKGVDLKKFGARTIHNMFLDDASYSQVFDETLETYRITIVQKSS
ncbi:hypothetical protein MNBD_NITROSPINAE02-513 [hydrothermal vent metagenome]|uniref:Methyltransferase type 12 domain-containing protein n=1 Tax=hydrothermal vent metagenome TaxID=652676 RepID=A0A3B1CML8_9ZZZZ